MRRTISRTEWHCLAYAHEKLAAAVDMMATSELPLRERVLLARESLVAVDEADLPKDARADFRAFYARLTWAEDQQGEGTLRATTRLVSDAEERRLAQLIVDIAGRVVDAMTDGQGDPPEEAR